MSGKAELCHGLFTTLLEFSCAKEFSEQMEIARELFSIATGKANDEDSFFDNRMTFFQYYFLFEFRLSSIFSGATVFEVFLMRANKNMTKQDLSDYEELRTIRRSLFKVEKYSSDVIVVADLFSHRLETVYPLPQYCFAGFEVGRIFDSRLVCFRGINFFAGTFIFHPEEVRELIEKHIKNFLIKRTRILANNVQNWRTELNRRHDILAVVAEQKKVLDCDNKKKSIDILNVSKNLISVSQDLNSGNLIMALGTNEEISPFVPEVPFYDTASLLDSLAYSELKCCRYKHIMPEKLYSFDKKDSTLPQYPISMPANRVNGHE